MEEFESTGELPMGVIIVYVAILVLIIASFWKIYEKAGKPGWAALVPIYNIIVLLQIVGKPAWWIILFLIPVVNIVIAVMVYHALSKSFGQGVGYTIGFLFLGIVFFPMLAFGEAQYIGAGGSAGSGALDSDF